MAGETTMTTENRKRLRAVEAAEFLRVSRSTLAKWRMRGEGPPLIAAVPASSITSWTRLTPGWPTVTGGISGAARKRHDVGHAFRWAWPLIGGLLAPVPVSSQERLDEMAEILAAGLMRLRARKSSPLSGHCGENSLDCAAYQSGHPVTNDRRTQDA